MILPLRLEWEPYYYHLALPVSVGTRVRVQFAGRSYVGVVSAVDVQIPSGSSSNEGNTSPDVSKIKEITSVEDGLLKVTESEIKLWRSVSQYYLCTIGEVYKAAYPARKIASEEIVARMQERKTAQRDKKIEALQSRLSRLQERLSKKQDLLSRAAKDTTKAQYNSDIESINADIQSVQSHLFDIESADSRQVINDFNENKTVFASQIVLTDEQSRALEQIKAIFNAGKVALLHGVTGSGKTEIYQTLAMEALQKGRNVLYLVPEIALSRQLEDRLETVFGDSIMTFHSAETMSYRQEVATAIRNNSRYVVLGTRSALFLPHHDLGLIIVDEEHDTSYKQDSPAPRYNGRDTAIMLSMIQRCPVILGSATPSLESIYNTYTGKFGRVILTKRYYDTENADVEVINTIDERRKRGMKGSFSVKLIDHIRQTLSEGGQVILLRARRAYSPSVQCQDCGDIPRCPHCNVPLSYHKDIGRLVCHYCGYSETYTGICHKCGGPMEMVGAGTQKIEEETRALFPQARIARLDSDSAQEKDYEKRVISSFSSGEVDILIGTQIVTKGFDFSGLTLVAVLQADSILGQQDFRADERALQLLEQFRGRCGRRGKKGLFVIQTKESSHPLFNRLSHPDDEDQASFDERLLSERKDFGYPPYTRLVNVIIKDSNAPRLARLSDELARAIADIFGTRPALLRDPSEGVSVIGPYSPVIDRISDEYIRHIRLMFSRDRSLSGRKQALCGCIARFEKDRSYSGHIYIDVDPL